MGGAEQLARLAGLIAGLGLAIAAAAPFTGVPPRGASGALAPAQIEVRVLASGEFELDPVGTVLKAAPFPAPGERGGPTMAVTVRNISGLPLRVSARLTGLAPTLDGVATLRGSVGGAVVLRGAIERSSQWTPPMGLIAPGETSTLRIRFKLRPGLDPNAFAGRLDIRQLELKGTAPGRALEVPSDVPQVVPGTEGAAPATTPSAAGGSAVATPTPALTPAPPPPPGAGEDGPRRRAPDEGDA